MRCKALDQYLRGCVEDGLIPGCVCWAGNRSDAFFHESYGHAQLVPAEAPMTRETIFDLASLTKPVATALSIMLLVERRLLDLDAQIKDLMSGLGTAGAGSSTVRQLLAHASGLPAWYPLYLVPEPNRLRFLAGLTSGRNATVYSCLGYILLGRIVEHVAGQALDTFFRENVIGRLGCRALGFGPVADRDMAAATEQGNEHEREMARKHGDVTSIPWRNRTIRGEVHDGNAHYAFGGVAGNAGLFGRALDLALFLRAYVAGEIIKPATLNLMLTEQTPAPEKRNLGWHADPYPGLLSARAYGHTGFTGTMCAVDPQTGLIIVLLANAVHPRVRLNIMQPIRREVVRIINQKVR